MVKKRHQHNGHDPRVIAKARLSQESGAVFKPHAGRFTVALAYPNSYQTGMSNLGFQKVYHLLNRRDDVVCERVFHPGAEEMEFMRKHRRALESMESGKPIGEFDMVAFSITFEDDCINALCMLNLGRIPLENRGGNQPLVMAGGLVPTLNPEVMAPFIDAALIGEAEGITDPLMDALINSERREILSLAGLPGVYVTGAYTPQYNNDGSIRVIRPAPGFPEQVMRVWSHDAVRAPNITRITTPDTVFGDMRLVEMGKGCGKHCRFCAAGYAYRPTRHADAVALGKSVDEALDKKGKVGLVGSAVADHPDALNLFRRIVERGGEFSVSSLRLDMIDERLLELLKKGGRRSVTVAPEAGTERLRRKINKPISDEQILDAARLLSESGIFELKLYFLVGLPGETQEDIDGITQLVKSIRVAMYDGWKKIGRAGVIIASVNPFTPKPFTPFQWAPYGGIKSLESRLKILRAGLARIPNVTARIGSARYGYVQTLLSVGGRRVAPVLRKACELDGDWFRAIRQSGVDTDFFVTRTKRMDEIFPWSAVSHGLKEDYILRDYKKSLDDRITPQCAPPGVECSRCGMFIGVCQSGGEGG